MNYQIQIYSYGGPEVLRVVADDWRDRHEHDLAIRPDTLHVLFMIWKPKMRWGRGW